MGLNMNRLFGGFLTMLLGISLTPTVADTVATQLVNLTGAAKAVADMIPLVWVFAVVGIGAGLVYTSFGRQV